MGPDLHQQTMKNGFLHVPRTTISPKKRIYPCPDNNVLNNNYFEVKISSVSPIRVIVISNSSLIK